MVSVAYIVYIVSSVLWLRCVFCGRRLSLLLRVLCGRVPCRVVVSCVIRGCGLCLVCCAVVELCLLCVWRVGRNATLLFPWGP